MQRNALRFAARLVRTMAAAAAFSCAAVARAQISDLGPLAGGSTTSAAGVSATGAKVVGTSGTSTYAHGVFWEGGTPFDLGVLPTGRLSSASAISADASVIVGSSGFIQGPGVHAVRLTELGLTDLTPGVGASSSNAWGVSADGSVIVGEAGQAFRWTSAGGLELLGLLQGGTYSQAYGVSDDGAVIVGGGTSTAGYRGFVWTQGAGMTALETLPGGSYSRACGVSRDGAVPFGDSGSSAGNRAVRWTAAGVQSLGVLPGGTTSTARASNLDGSVIVGDGDSPAGTRAVWWSAQTGLVDLNAYLPARGIDLTGWTLTEARGLTPDARVIVGTGQHQTPEGTLSRAWMVTLGQSCYANCDGSATPPVLNIADFTCFLVRFAAGEAYANCDGSTTPPVLNFADFTCFLQRFATGCR